MESEGFSVKEILIQLMADVRSTRTEINEQRIMLTEHIQSSKDRDKQIKEIKTDIEGIEIRIGKLEGFKIKVLAIWGGIWSVATLLIVYLLDKFWK